MSRNEKAIVDDVHVVVDGGRGDAVRKAAYALHVAALLLVTYGVTLAHAFFLTQDPAWLREQVASWQGGLVLGILAAVAVVAAWRAGRVRGPVVPPVPWIDLVVPGPIDRAIVLRRWWQMSALLLVTGAAMVGAVVGGGAWFARVGDPVWLAVGALGATLLGVMLLLVWLFGQVSVSATGWRWGSRSALWRPAQALRLLRLEDLRTQAARATRMGGAVLLGDLRSLRLEVAAPVTRARGRRLRPGPAWSVIPRRDILGLIRSPGAAVIAVPVTMIAAAGLAWALLHAAVPIVVALLCGLLLHLGFSAAAEGLRLQGDNAGTPSLLGLGMHAEALGHLAVPVLVAGGTALLTAATVGWAAGVSPAYLLAVVGWLALMAVIAVGTTMASAFRGGAPIQAFLPEAGPVMMLLWVGRQAMLAAVAVGGLTASAAHGGLLVALLPAALVASTCVAWGFTRVRAVALEHRV